MKRMPAKQKSKKRAKGKYSIGDRHRKAKAKEDKAAKYIYMYK